MYNVEDIISDSEDEITTFLEPFEQKGHINGLASIIRGETTLKDSSSAADEENEDIIGSEELYFHMTQMQAIHESVTDLEKESELQKKSILSLRSLRCDSSDQIDDYEAPEPARKRGRRKATPGGKTRKKNQSMSNLVREVFESDKSKYFIAKQSRIDEFCSRPNNSNTSRTLQNRRFEQLGEKQLLSSDDWLKILQSIRINFPQSSCITNIDTHERIEYRTLWDEASSNVTLNNEEIKVLYNK